MRVLPYIFLGGGILCAAPFVIWFIIAMFFMLWDWIKAVFLPKWEHMTDRMEAACCLLGALFVVFMGAWAWTCEKNPKTAKDEQDEQRIKQIVHEILKEMEVSNGTDSQTIPSSGE